MYLDLVEYMCRCGLYNLVPQLKNEVDMIYDSVDEQGICRVNYCENALKGMGTYSGGQLEEDWRSKTRKLCDVTYRGLLIYTMLERYRSAGVLVIHFSYRKKMGRREIL